MTERRYFRDLSPEQAACELRSIGEPQYRIEQVLAWVWLKRADSFDQMTNVGKATRSRLNELFTLEKMPVVEQRVSSARDAVKFALQLNGSSDAVECVLLIDRQRRTACLSSQLGCALGCTFCATGSMGFVRNLTQSEVLGQLIAINDYLAAAGDKPVTHVVFMGMGEALFNYDVFASSCDVIHAEWGFGLAMRRITVSTAGVVPSIERLLSDGPHVHLAISLNHFSDAGRSAVMPINKRYPIAQVVQAGRRYAEASGCRLTFEYVVIHGQTDTAEAVNALVRMLSSVPCKVNCIPLNPGGTGAGEAPQYEDVLRFVKALHDRGLTATARRSRGRDIDGACGQLCARRVSRG